MPVTNGTESPSAEFIRWPREVPDSLDSSLADTIGAEGRSSVRSTKYNASHPSRIPRYPPTEPEHPLLGARARHRILMVGGCQAYYEVITARACIRY